MNFMLAKFERETPEPERERTMPAGTHCWGGYIPHLPYKGMLLTPRIERYRTQQGWRARDIDGLPIVERDHSGRVVYALPGGGGTVG